MIKNMMNNKIFTVGGLFSGVGGIELGFSNKKNSRLPGEQILIFTLQKLTEKTLPTLFMKKI